MMRRTEITSCLIAIALLTRAVRADAPLAQYKPFDASDRVIVDLFTGLEWDRSIEPTLRTAGASDTFCVNAGKRRPTVKELLSIVDEVRHKEQVGGKAVELAVDGAAFGGRQFAVDGWFWSSTLNKDNIALQVSIQSGAVRIPKPGQQPDELTARVRCVRYLP
jgi:hypothetical protein